MTTNKEVKEGRSARLAVARAAPTDSLGAGKPGPWGPQVMGISGRQALAALVLILLVTVSFVPAYLAEFVWDDKAITDDPMVKSASGFSKIWSSPGEMKHEGHYWPVTYTTFWLEHRLWGLNPLGYHLVNVLLHLVNVLLLWRLLDRLSVPGAWIVAAIFAVHPLHVESVAWIIERKDILSGLFSLTAFLAYVRFVESRSRGPYLLALVLFVAGLLSKTVVVTLPAALMIWHWWQRGRIAAGDLLRTAPFFAVGLAIAFADTAFYRTREVLSLDYSLVERILIAARALWFYAGKLLWPTDLAVIYPLWDIEARDPLGWTLVALAVAVPTLLWLGRGRWGRGPLACVAFYAATLSPALGLIDYGYMQFALVADRFQYLAGIGLVTLIVAALVRGADRLPAAAITSAKIVLAAVLAVLGTLTWRHAANFRDGVTLFSHIVSLNPEARSAHVNLSQALIEAGRYEASLKPSRVAIAQSSDPTGAHMNLGVALMSLGRFEEADGALGRALEISPRDLLANQNLAESMRRQGRHDEAVAQFRRVLQIDETYAFAWSALGETYFDSGRYEQAIDAVKRAFSIDPHSTKIASFHLLLGKASREAGRLRAAERNLLRAAELAPDQTDALRELATLYLRMGRLEDANAIAARARQLEPRSPATLHAGAEALRSQKRNDEAIAVYREALEMDSESAASHAGIGMALFDLQRYEEAIRSLERAFDIDPDLPEASSLHRVTGQALQELGRLEEATPRFERAFELDPLDTVALDHLAFLCFDAGRHEDAFEYYRKLLEIDDANAAAHANMGITLFNLGRYAQAVQSLERSLALDPEQATARSALEEARRRAPAGEP